MKCDYCDKKIKKDDVFHENIIHWGDYLCDVCYKKIYGREGKTK